MLLTGRSGRVLPSGRETRHDIDAAGERTGAPAGLAAFRDAFPIAPADEPGHALETLTVAAVRARRAHRRRCSPHRREARRTSAAHRRSPASRRSVLPRRQQCARCPVMAVQPRRYDRARSDGRGARVPHAATSRGSSSAFVRSARQPLISVAITRPVITRSPADGSWSQTYLLDRWEQGTDRFPDVIAPDRLGQQRRD
jgi:hypothetical protein